MVNKKIMPMCEEKKSKEVDGFTDHFHYFEGGKNPSSDQKCRCGKYTIAEAVEKSSWRSKIDNMPL